MSVTPRIGMRIAASAAAFGAVARNPALRRVELAFLGFNLAEWGIWVAILVFAYGRGGASEVALVAVLQLAPAAFIAPLAASLGDRYPRERVLLAAYLLQAAVVGAIAASMLADAPVAIVYALAAAANTTIALTRPVQAAILPSLSRTPAELTAANVAASSIETTAILIGPAVAGIALQSLGPVPVFAAAAVLSVAAAFLVAGLPRTLAPDRDEATSGIRSVVGETLAGFSMLAREERPRSVVLLLGAASVLWGALDVLLVILALDELSMGQSGVGFLNAAIGAGGIAGAVFAALLIGRARLAGPFGVGLLLWGGALAAIGFLPLPLVALLLLAVAGMGRVVMDVAGRTLLQRVAPEALLSRVFGVLEGIDNASLAIGSLVAPALLAVAGTRGAFITAGAALIAFTALSWRRLLRTDASGTVRPRELAALMRVPFFVNLNGPALERLASALIPISARPGARIITEGQLGDRFYIIASGEVEVDVDGTPVRTMGAGESFGEIALLRQIPRTASVTAVTSVELLALDRHHFVETVTGQPVAAEAAEAVIHAHLERAIDQRSDTDAGS
ncbi:MAG: MFS transporter [Chloroflexota bacterium]